MFRAGDLRRLRDGEIGVQPHQRRAESRGKAGGDEHRALVHARLGEDRRIDEGDVDHSHVRRQAGDEALLVVGSSRHERLAAMQRIRRGDALSLDAAEWLRPYQVDAEYFKMLPSGLTEFKAEEATELTRIFGKYGELPATRVS